MCSWVEEISAAWSIVSVSGERSSQVELSKEELAKRHFVKLHYRHSRRILSTIAELPDGLMVKTDDQVEVWPADCLSGKFSRISRILAP